jgi:hypothetical protein
VAVALGCFGRGVSALAPVFQQHVPLEPETYIAYGSEQTELYERFRAHAIRHLRLMSRTSGYDVDTSYQQAIIEAYTRTFWANPENKSDFHAMDGLAQKNFLHLIQYPIGYP